VAHCWISASRPHRATWHHETLPSMLGNPSWCLAGEGTAGGDPCHAYSCLPAPAGSCTSFNALFLSLSVELRQRFRGLLRLG
jgi:hypothetical protein